MYIIIYIIPYVIFYITYKFKYTDMLLFNNINFIL